MAPEDAARRILQAARSGPASGLAGGDDGPSRPMASGAGAGVLRRWRGTATGSCVPPSMRNADGSRSTDMAARDDSCTVRVSNLSEDVKDSDLRELFRRFGAIQRIYLAKDRETHPSRGLAFINFFARDDAQRAIDKLDGHGYDHLILSVTWANPSAQGPKQEAPGMDARAFPSLGGASDVRRETDRFDKHVFDSGLDRFRT